MEETQFLEINAEKRTIAVPSDLLLGVLGDKDVERVYFRCPKIVGDNINLAEHQIYIKYVTAPDNSGERYDKKDPGIYHCQDVIDEGEYITFSWKLSRNVFEKEGFIAFSMLADDGEVTRWNTFPAIGTVLITIPGGLEEVAEKYPDIITQLLNRMDEVEEIATPEAMQRYVDTYLAEHPVELDETLTDNTKAAPADVVGELKGDLTDVYDGSIVWNDGAFINQEHRILSDTGRCFSDFILCPPKGKIRFWAETGNPYVSAISFCDKENRLLTKFSNLSSGEQTVDIPIGAKYFRLSGLIIYKNKYYYKFVDNSLLGHIYEDMPNRLEKRVSDLENIIHVKNSYNLLDINNMLESRGVNDDGNIVVNPNMNLSERIYVDNTIKLRTTTNFNQTLTQYKKDGTRVGYISKFNSSNPIDLNEETDYILLSAWKDTLPFCVYQSEEVLPYIDYGKSSDAIRNIVEIYNSDTEEEIYLKMYEAYKKRNCDVYWETGTYEFSTIFELLKTKYGRGTAYELPIGGNCRYFFNGSILIATQVSTDPNVINNESLMGSWRGSGNYELHDGILRANGMVYVIHDEASGSLIPYTRKYRNMRMEYVSNENQSGMCLGGGTGCKGNVEFDGCVFITNSNSSMDGGYHGKTANIDVESVFYATVKNCYFSKRFQTAELTANETAELIYCGNSHVMSPDGDKWNIIEWNNTKR